MAGSTSVTHCNIQGGHSGRGNIDADPLFVDALNGDYSLVSSSPCIDAGDTGELTFCVDYGLQPRLEDDPSTPDTGEPLLGLTIDMGAYEFQPPGCPADNTDDGFVNVSDLLALLAAWGACP